MADIYHYCIFIIYDFCNTLLFIFSCGLFIWIRVKIMQPNWADCVRHYQHKENVNMQLVYFILSVSFKLIFVLLQHLESGRIYVLLLLLFVLSGTFLILTSLP